MNSNLRRWIALVVVCFGQLMIMLDATIVNVALPYIQRDLGFSQADLTWVVNAYLIAYGSFLLLAGRLGDLFGRRLVFLAGVGLFTLASVATGFAPAAENLIIGRFLQGLGGSLSAGVIIAIIVTEFQQPAERAQAMSVFTLTIAAGGSLGLLLGGLITQFVSWHWIFIINLPIGVVTMAMGAWLIKENAGSGLSQGIDIVGAVLVTAALMIGVYGIVTAADYGWASAHTLGFGGAALALLAAFVAFERRIANPIMPLRILGIRTLTTASAARALVFTGISTTFFIGVLYLQHVRGYNAFETGLAFLPMTLILGAMSLGINARLMARFGPGNLMTFGMSTMLTALVVLALADDHASYFPWLLAGLASGFSNASQQVGGALGLAALGTLATNRAGSLLAHGDALRSALAGGYQLGFILAAGAVGLALIVAVILLRPAQREAEAPAREGTPAEAEAAA